MLQNSSIDDAQLSRACIRCIETWIDFDGTNLLDWQSIIVLCLSKIQTSSPDLISYVSTFFQNLVENSELSRMENFVGQLYDYASHLVTILAKMDREEEIFEDLAKMIITLATHQSKIFFKLLKQNSTSVSNIVEFILQLSSTPGYFPVEETFSALPISFWYNLQEEVTVVEDKQVLNENLTFVRPIYDRLFSVLSSKIQYPPEDQFQTSWSSSDREKFESYRIDLSDTLTCCYRIIGVSMTESLLNLAGNCLSSGWRTLEGLLYIYESIGEYVGVQNAYVKRFFQEICYQIPATAHQILSNTLLRTISKYNHVVTDDPDLIRRYAGTILSFLEDAACVTNATLALRDLCSSKNACFKDETSNFTSSVVMATRKCFENGALGAPDRLRALSCLGFVLSLQPADVILRNLNEILAPRLEKLQRFNENNNSFANKNEFLFEFDVVSVLVGSLSADDTKPVFLVISQSLPLFKTLYATSGGDAEVANKLCHTLKCALVALMDELRELVANYCELIVFMYETNPRNACVVELTKSVYVMFANDNDLRPLLANIFNRLLRTTICSLSSQNVREFADSVEETLKLCYTLSKKCWTFFASSDVVCCDCSAAVELACACLTAFADSTTSKEAAAFLCEFLKHCESPVVCRIVDANGSAIVAACFERLKVEILTSSLEYVADVLFILSSSYKQYLLTWRQLLPDHHLVTAMMKEIGNKRKFREFAKQINLACRKNVFTL